MSKEKKSVVLIAGGTGLTGKSIIPVLLKEGCEVRILSRDKREIPGTRSFRWNIMSEYVQEGAVEDVEHLVNLAGRNIGSGRWSGKAKKEIIDSRVLSNKLLFDITEKRNPSLKTFICASATGYYGAITTDKILREADPSGKDFAAQVCKKWEDSAGLFRLAGYRTCIARTGIVLSGEGGMIKKVLPTLNMRFSPFPGNGRQYLPWIHIDDLCGIYLKLIKDNTTCGVYNAVSPEPVSYKDFIGVLSDVKKRKVLAPSTPVLPWKILLGEKSSILLEGSRVSAEKIINSGYKFMYPELYPALSEILNR